MPPTQSCTTNPASNGNRIMELNWVQAKNYYLTLVQTNNALNSVEGRIKQLSTLLEIQNGVLMLVAAKREATKKERLTL